MDLLPPRGILFDFGNTFLREGPVDLQAGADAVLRVATDRAGCTTVQLASTSRRMASGSWEDSFECDVAGAAAAGMIPIWYRPKDPVPAAFDPAAAVVSSWSDFDQLLTSIGMTSTNA